jgi:RNA polymerase sigma-70 factor (ECF subfamily)
MTHHCEKSLLKQVSEGDENAFKNLFNIHRDSIYSVAFTFVKSVELAEEIVQDVFLKIWLRREGLTDIQNFKAYLFVITRNHVYKVLKQIAQDYKTTLSAVEDHLLADNDAVDLVMEKEYSLLLQRAIARLPNQQREVYTLIRDHGLKRNEVACQLNLQPETVKFHLAQAMKNIRSFCMLHLNSFIIILFCLNKYLGIF